jgi:hypothetical protein
MSELVMADKLPGDGLMGWLGRQIGHVKKAIKSDPQSATSAPSVSADPSPSDTSQPRADTPANASPNVIYRQDRVDEAPHPENPGLKMRRTVIDEIIIDDSRP